MRKVSFPTCYSLPDIVLMSFFFKTHPMEFSGKIGNILKQEKWSLLLTLINAILYCPYLVINID